MSTEKKLAVLVVSFGTSYADTCVKTIEAIENAVKEAYPFHAFYRAWTNERIRSKVWKRDKVHIFSVKEALEQMKKDGAEEVLVQLTHVVNGIERELMMEAVKEAQGAFACVSVGDALLTTQKDCEKVIEVLEKELSVEEDEALVFMGHGTKHYANFVYSALNDQFLTGGHENWFMGTVKGYPELEDVLAAVKKTGLKKVVLTPFMIVAGDHANNDLAGEEEDSWKSVFEKEGYEVRCVLKGLGEYEGIRKLFLEHLAQAEEVN